jgi:uncharacterized iron-regulated protein
LRNRVPVGAWIDVAAGAMREDPLATLARRAVVLLGEQHDQAGHHRWQLDVMAALHGLRPVMVVGFEMFPRRVQPVLDRWTAGQLGEEEFLTATGWSQVWGFDAALYMPLFRFARTHRLRMQALNVDRATNRLIAERGLAAVPPAEREGVGDPAPARPAYRQRLADVFKMHLGAAGMPATPDRLERFVRAQQFWDRAMAEAIAGSGGGSAPPLVVGIMGRGHIEHGDGVPYQLADLGVRDVATALPWPADTDYPAGIADLLFGVSSDSRAA